MHQGPSMAYYPLGIESFLLNPSNKFLFTLGSSPSPFIGKPEEDSLLIMYNWASNPSLHSHVRVPLIAVATILIHFLISSSQGKGQRRLDKVIFKVVNTKQEGRDLRSQSSSLFYKHNSLTQHVAETPLFPPQNPSDHHHHHRRRHLDPMRFLTHPIHHFPIRLSLLPPPFQRRLRYDSSQIFHSLYFYFSLCVIDVVFVSILQLTVPSRRELKM